MGNTTLIKCEYKCWCVSCWKGIVRGEHYLRFDRSAYMRKFRINLCIGCIRELSKSINRTEMKNKIIREIQEKI